MRGAADRAIVRFVNSSLTELIAGRLVGLGRLVAGSDDPRRASTRVLLRTVAAGGSPTLSTVAAAAGIAKSTASELVGGLEANGLLRRERAAGDRRRLALQVTPRGRRALATHAPLDTARLSSALATLTEAETETLADLLGKVSTALTAPDQAAQAALAAGSTPEPPASESGDRRLLVVQVTGGEFGLPLERIREVVAYRAPRRIATSSAWLAGVLPVRGALYPVCRLAERLGFAADALAGSETAAYVLVDGPDGPAGLAVSAVVGPALAPAAGITPPLGGGIGVNGIADLGDRLVVLLDVDELLTD